MGSDEDFVWLCLSEYRGPARYFHKFAIAKYNKYREEVTYRIYMADGMRAIVGFFSGETEQRYVDLLTPRKEETRTSEEIVNAISAKLDSLGGA